MVVIRRCIIAIIITFSVVGCTPPPASEEAMNDFAKAWQRYLALFYDQGRIVDTGNNEVSHSEGQGYAMLFAVAANDRATFDAIWQWTRSVLQRKDSLFHWQYKPCEYADFRCVTDPNNASDGDMLIAWALLRAAERWQEQSYQQSALTIIDTLEETNLVEFDGYTLLLPGEFGFVAEDGSVQVNLSYWIFPAIQAFVQMRPDSKWQALYDSGIQLTNEAQFGEFQLPPDWMRVSPSEVSLNNTISAEYGFNACRVPLHLVWAGELRLSLLTRFEAFWELPVTPATVNLATGEQAEYAMTPGMKSLASTVMSFTSNAPPQVAEINRHTDYYSGSLILFSMLARQELTE